MVDYYLFLMVLLMLMSLDILTCSGKKILIFLSALLIYFFIGLRYKLGVDWLFYLDNYQGIKTKLTIEPAYEFLATLSSYIMGFWFFTSLITLLTIFSVTRFFYKYSPYPVFSIGCYFIISFGFNVEALRQIIAVSLFYIGLTAYFSNKKLVFYICCFCGSLFHMSILALIFVPLLFNDFFLKLGRRLLYCGLVLSLLKLYPVKIVIDFLVRMIGGPYLEKISLYTLDSDGGNAITFNLLFKIAIYCFYLLSKKRMLIFFKEKKMNYNILESIELLFLLMLLIDLYFMPFGTISSRYDEYFIPAMIVCLCCSIRINSVYTNRILAASFFSVILSVSFIRFTNNEYFVEQYVPYGNSVFQILNQSTDDVNRANSVFLHWKLRSQ